MRNLSIILTFLLLSNLAFAEEMKMDFDWACFRHNDEFTRLELYYSFLDSLFDYNKTQADYQGKILFDVKINSTIKTEAQERWIVENNVEDPSKNILIMFGQKNFLLRPGQYTIFIEAMDVNDTSKTLKRSSDLLIRDFSGHNLNSSDLEFANFIEHESKTSLKWNEMFYKNTLYVIPNPSKEILSASPELNVYFEIYNAKKNNLDSVFIEYRIFDGVKREKYKYERLRECNSDAFVEFISIPLDIQPTGVYFLQVLVSDISKKLDSLVLTKKFYLYNFNLPPEMNTYFLESKDFEHSEFSTMPPERVDLEYQKAKIIATNFEIDVYEKLNTHESRQRFLYEFWLERDYDTTTRVNERRVEFEKAIAYANTYFSIGDNIKGWNTERGHVLLKHNFPTDVERQIAVGNNRAYETWYYDDLQGGVEFVFVDIGGYNDYILVHSTATGQIYMPDWYDRYVPIIRNSPGQLENDNQKSYDPYK